MTTVYKVHFCLNRINTYDFMSVIREAASRNRADITQSEDANSQDMFLSYPTNSAYTL